MKYAADIELSHGKYWQVLYADGDYLASFPVDDTETVVKLLRRNRKVTPMKEPSP